MKSGLNCTAAWMVQLPGKAGYGVVDEGLEKWRERWEATQDAMHLGA